MGPDGELERKTNGMHVEKELTGRLEEVDLHPAQGEHLTHRVGHDALVLLEDLRHLCQESFI